MAGRGIVKLHRVISNRLVGTGSFVLRVERTDGPIKAGQCFSVGTADTAINREYSIYSGENDPYIEFLIRRVDDGILTPQLAKLRAGDSVYVAGPFGAFCIDNHQRQEPLVFIATGTGVAPFHSFIHTYTDLDYRLYWGVRDANDLADLNTYDGNRIHVAVSRSAEGTRERVTDLLARNKPSNRAHFYLCGNRAMIVDVTKLLLAQGVPGGSIFMETFF